jgi:hypothetical protein
MLWDHGGGSADQSPWQVHSLPQVIGSSTVCPGSLAVLAACRTNGLTQQRPFARKVRLRIRWMDRHVLSYFRVCGADVVRKVEQYLGGPLDSPPQIHVVRDVAPNKIMLCVSFRVPHAVAFAGRRLGGSEAHAAATTAAAAAAATSAAAAAAAAGGPPNKKSRTTTDAE